MRKCRNEVIQVHGVAYENDMYHCTSPISTDYLPSYLCYMYLAWELYWRRPLGQGNGKTDTGESHNQQYLHDDLYFHVWCDAV